MKDAMKDVTNKIFLTYANNSFRENFNNVYKLIKAIRSFQQAKIDDIGFNFTTDHFSLDRRGCTYELPFFLPDSELENIVHKMERLSKLGQREAMMEHVMRNDGPPIQIDLHNIAYTAVYRYDDNILDDEFKSCEDCLYFIGRRPDILLECYEYGCSGFIERTQLKCYECDYLGFIQMIDRIIDGDEYHSTTEFHDYLDARNRSAISVVGEINDSTLKQYTSFSTKSFFHEKKSVYLLYAFSNFLKIFVGYSLIEFLLNTDRRKLKKCPHCGIYFIANDIRRQRCYSDDCKKEYERQKKQIQREKYPLKYAS